MYACVCSYIYHSFSLFALVKQRKKIEKSKTLFLVYLRGYHAFETVNAVSHASITLFCRRSQSPRPNICTQMYIAESLFVRCCCSCCQFNLLCFSLADRLSILPTILSFLVLPLVWLVCRRGLVIRLVAFHWILLYHLDDVDDSSETVSLHSLVDHHAPRYCP